VVIILLSFFLGGGVQRFRYVHLLIRGHRNNMVQAMAIQYCRELGIFYEKVWCRRMQTSICDREEYQDPSHQSLITSLQWGAEQLTTKRCSILKIGNQNLHLLGFTSNTFTQCNYLPFLFIHNATLFYFTSYIHTGIQHKTILSFQMKLLWFTPSQWRAIVCIIAYSRWIRTCPSDMIHSC